MKLAAFVLSSIPLLINFYSRKYMEEDKARTLTELEGDLSLPRIKTYDFIIVGAGTSGCILAGRLSESFNVLLLETGGEPVPASQVPYFVPQVGFDLETNYQFPSVPQKNASLRTGGVITDHLGKMLGGSGSHHDMVHNRGSPHDYDNYARILNDDSWTYDNVLEYFKKSENFIGERFSRDYEGNYGDSGPVIVDTDLSPTLPTWFEAGEELGYPINDPNGYQTESFAPGNKAAFKGQRSSSYNGFLKLIKDTRENLTVLPYSFVTEVLIDDNLKAYGVAYERHGIPQIAYAAKEVIISGGPYCSPLLLMRSGVGPRDQLEAAEIPVKLDLPHVGQHINDHLILDLSPITYNESVTPLIPKFPEGRDFERMLQDYQENGEGFVGEVSFPLAFISSTRAKAEGQGHWPDIQISYNPLGAGLVQTTVPNGAVQTAEDDLPVSGFYVWNNRPKLNGSLTLNTTAYKAGRRDDMSLAVIDFKIFEGASETDMDVMVEAIQWALEIVNTTAFQKLGTRYSGVPLEACKDQEFMSDEYWRCFVKQVVATAYHPVGACSLGKVVDSKFRVNGIANLRVADSSVFPLVPNSNLNAPTLMIAEKAADDIAKAWN